jgi:hypothetical protein
MSDPFVEMAQNNMGWLEKLLKGLPGISGYVNKELRRDADKQVRELLAGALEQSKASIVELQKRLLKGGGLQYMDDVDEAMVKLQTLVDRVTTASYGYAGLFDAVRIKEEQIDALVRFDQAVAAQVGGLNEAINAVAMAIGSGENLGATISRLTQTVTNLHMLYDRRREAVVSPDLLSQPGYAPPVQSS